MSLADPRAALAEQSSFIGYLVGLAGVGRAVRALAVETGDPPRRDADDFVHVLLGLASLGAAIDRIAESVPQQCDSTPEPISSSKWLR